jgi:LuxR family quorum-sensing transcriptional regulator LasR
MGLEHHSQNFGRYGLKQPRLHLGGIMNTNDIIADLVTQGDVDAWRDQVVQFGANLGYQHATLVIFPSHVTPMEIGNAFLHTTLPAEFVVKYDQEKYIEVDPVVEHCLHKITPMIWSSSSFTSDRQCQLYDLASHYGARSGIALPHHGPSGEFGMLCYATTSRFSEKARQEVLRDIPELSYFRDYILEVFGRLIKKPIAMAKGNIELTAREIECMKWCASGKSSWDIAKLMNCTEATINYHFTNIRRKFGASSRRMAIIKAIRLGYIEV